MTTVDVHVDGRPTAHGGQKEDGGEDKRVSSEHGFGKTSLSFIVYMNADIQAATTNVLSRLAVRADLPATTTVVLPSKL